MRQRRLAPVKEVHQAIVGLGPIVEVLILHINILFAVDVFVGGVGFSCPRFPCRQVDFVIVICLPDMRQILRLEAEITGIEAPVLVRPLKNGLRMMLVGEIVGIDIGGLQSHSGIVPTTVLPDGQKTVLLRVTRQIAELLRVVGDVTAHVGLHDKLLVRVGQGRVIGITRQGGTDMDFLIQHHETTGKQNVVVRKIITENHEQVIARNEWHHVLDREPELIVDIVNHGVAGKGVVVDTLGLITRSVFYTLNVCNLPIVCAMNEGVVEHFALAVDDIKGKREAAQHVVQGYNRVAELVVVGI